MIIGIDASSLTLPYPTGVQLYAKFIIKNLIDIGREHRFRLYSSKALPIEYKKHQVLIKSPFFWTQIRLPIELMMHKPDVFFQPGYMLPPFCPCKAVATIHDLAWVHYPSAYSATDLHKQQLSVLRAMKHRAKIIVPSISARDDLLDNFAIDPSQIKTIPEALIPLPDVLLTDYPDILRHKRNVVVLAVGRLEERKNQTTLIRAMTNLVNNQSKKPGKIALILIGQPGFGAHKVFEAMNEAKKSGVDIIYRANADDRELAAWFKIANVFVYPSLYEGFGLPILQAFAAKVPVVTVRNSSIPEVAGDAVMYVAKPKDEAELAAAINAVLFDAHKSDVLIKKGTEQLKLFSWHTAVISTLKVLMEQANTKI